MHLQEREHGDSLADIGCEGEAPRPDSTIGETFEGDGDSGVNEGGKER
jgi:hypothetical protein